MPNIEYLLNQLEHVNATGELGVNSTEYRNPPDIMEWRHISEAIYQIDLAREDADHMRDNVLRQEHIDLTDKMRQWIEGYGQNPLSLKEDEAMDQIQRKTGLERRLFIEFLSALWSENAANLKRLRPLELDDATTTDAVLGGY